jgi:hypothetical protein
MVLEFDIDMRSYITIFLGIQTMIFSLKEVGATKFIKNPAPHREDVDRFYYCAFFLTDYAYYSFILNLKQININTLRFLAQSRFTALPGHFNFMMLKLMFPFSE